MQSKFGYKKIQKRIKIGVVGFTINSDDNDHFVVHSVFRDRSEILKHLNSNIF